MIVFAMISGASVGALFIASAVPGILIGLSQLVVVYFISRKKGYHPKPVPFDRKHFIKTMLNGIPAIVMPVVIIVCVSFGVCTASESAGIAVLYALLIGFFFYRELTERCCRSSQANLNSSASVMLIIGFTMILLDSHDAKSTSRPG